MVMWFPKLLPCKLCDPKNYAAAKLLEPKPGAMIEFRNYSEVLTMLKTPVRPKRRAHLGWRTWFSAPYVPTPECYNTQATLSPSNMAENGCDDCVYIKECQSADRK